MIKFIKCHLTVILSAVLAIILLTCIILIPDKVNSLQADITYTPDKESTGAIASTAAPSFSFTDPATLPPFDTLTGTPFVTPTKAQSAAPIKQVTPKPTFKPTPTPTPTRVYGTASYLMKSFINTQGMTIQTRFTVPDGFVRVESVKGSFADYVRNLPLYSYGVKAKEYADDEVSMVVSQEAQNAAVINRDVEIYEQCADSCMRTWADYLYYNGRYDEISFKISGNFDLSFSKWRQGYRVLFNGNTPYWSLSKSPDSSYQSLKDYLHFCYQYAYTGTLSNYLTSVKLSNMRIGDIFVKEKTSESRYGHAVMIADMAVNTKTGEVIFMLIQGSTPAVHNYVVLNPDSKYGSPWFPLNFGSSFYSADDWTFSANQLKRF